MTRYWFARYRVAPNEGRGLVLLGWQGRAVIAVFVLAMLAGAAIFAGLSFAGFMALGVILFVACAIAGGAFFLWAAVAKADPKQTVDDYRKAGVLR